MRVDPPSNKLILQIEFEGADWKSKKLAFDRDCSVLKAIQIITYGRPYIKNPEG